LRCAALKHHDITTPSREPDARRRLFGIHSPTELTMHGIGAW